MQRATEITAYALLLLFSFALVLFASSCSGTGDAVRTKGQGAADAASGEATGVRPASLGDAIGNIARLSIPPGAKTEAFDLLRRELISELARIYGAGSVRLASKLPKDGGAISDLSFNATDRTLSWTYSNRGDYDLSGEVGVSDITPLAAHFLEISGIPPGNSDVIGWIDGSSNGQIGVEDVTPIALSFLNDVASYAILTSTRADTGFHAISSVSVRNIFSGYPPVVTIPLPESSEDYIALEAVDGAGNHGVRSVPVHIGDLPVAYAVSPAEGVSGKSVKFSASYSGTTPIAFTWNFGAAATPSVTGMPTPTVTCGAPGTYDIAFYVENEFGKGAFHSSFTVYAPPTAALSASPPVANPPCTIAFDASESVAGKGAINLVEWDFDADGVFEEATGTTPFTSHDYDTPGTYSATVRVTDAGDSDTADASFRVNASPVAAMNVTQTDGPAPLAVVFDASESLDPDGATLYFSWDFDGDGTYELDTAGTPLVQHTYYAPGAYAPSVKVMDADGASDSAARTVVSRGWRLVTVAATGLVGKYCSLAEVDGRPAASFFDVGRGLLLYSRALDAYGGAWSAPGVVVPSGGSYTSLEDAAGAPGISYYDAADGDFNFIRATDAAGSSWNAPLVLDSDGNVGAFSSLEIVSGNPAASYYDGTNSDLKYIRALDAAGGHGMRRSLSRQAETSANGVLSRL